VCRSLIGDIQELSAPSEFWFERLSKWIGLPLWAGVIAAASLPFLATYLPLVFLHPRGEIFSMELQNFLITLPLGVLALLAALYIRGAATRLLEYAESIVEEELPWDITGMHDTKWCSSLG
jgi:hypothetical protein